MEPNTDQAAGAEPAKRGRKGSAGKLFETRDALLAGYGEVPNALPYIVEGFIFDRTNDSPRNAQFYVAATTPLRAVSFAATSPASGWTVERANLKGKAIPEPEQIKQAFALMSEEKRDELLKELQAGRQMKIDEVAPPAPEPEPRAPSQRVASRGAQSGVQEKVGSNPEPPASMYFSLTRAALSRR